MYYTSHFGSMMKGKSLGTKHMKRKTIGDDNVILGSFYF